MYQAKQARSYRRGINSGSRSYRASMGIPEYDIQGNMTISNPLKSAEQYGLMQAVASGYAKVKGIGRAVAEKLIRETPARERSRFAQELAMKKSNKSSKQNRQSRMNPSETELGPEEEMSRQFHGRDALETVEVTEYVAYKPNAVIMGDLEELGILTQNGKNIITISFMKRQPKACCDAEGQNIELIGGDQRLTVPDNVGTSEKDLLSLGFCVSIVYRTDKHHLDDTNGEVVSYEHYFAEEWYQKEGYTGKKFFEKALDDGIVMKAGEKGLLPLVVYKRDEEKILMVGGKYRIEDVGIRD